MNVGFLFWYIAELHRILFLPGIGAAPRRLYMVYVITDQGVKVGRSLREINKKYRIELEPAEMYSCGADQIVKLTREDIDFVQDKHRMSNIMFGNFFRQDNSGKLLTVANIILTCVILLSSCGAG